jgi:hypothetical protein
MSQPSSCRFLVTSLALLASASASASEVRGNVYVPPPSSADVTIGYARTRVASPSSAARTARGDAALFLKVKESLPLPPPTTKWPLKIEGLRFSPQVATCAIDETIELTNNDPAPLTVMVGKTALNVAPGQTVPYQCQTGGLYTLRVPEWPHMRGLVYIGEVGVSGVPREDGKFALSAPQGTYDLIVVGADGPVATVPVTVEKKDVDLGQLGTPPPELAPAPKPRAQRPRETETKEPPSESAPEP